MSLWQHNAGAPPQKTNVPTVVAVSQTPPPYLSLIRSDGQLFCGGSATWRCRVHANEPLPAWVRAYGQGSWEARLRPQFKTTDNKEERGGKWWSERPTGGLCFPCTSALFNLSGGFPYPCRLGRWRVFPAVLLSGDNHAVLTVPHRRPEPQRAIRQASTWESSQRLHVHLNTFSFMRHFHRFRLDYTQDQAVFLSICFYWIRMSILKRKLVLKATPCISSSTHLKPQYKTPFIQIHQRSKLFFMDSK